MTALAIDADRTPGIVQGIVLSLPVTLAVMGTSAIAPVMPLLVAKFAGSNHSEYLVPALMMVPSLWIAFFSPFAGWLADAFGRRKLLIAAICIHAVAGVAPVYLNGNIWLIFASRCAVGMCESVALTVGNTLISDYFSGKQRANWLTGQFLVAPLSALVITPLGILLGSRLGWQGPFYLYTYSLVLALGVIKYTWEPSNSSNNVCNSDLQPQLTYFDLPWLRLFGLCTLTLVSAEMFYGSMVHGATALDELGVRDPGVMAIYLNLVVLGVPIGALIYRLLSHLKVGVMITLAFSLTSAGFWFIGHADSPIDYTLAAFSIQLGSGLVLPTLLIWTTDRLAYSIRGRGHGLWQSAFAIGQLVSGVTVSYFTVELGSLLASFNVLAVVAFLTAIGALVWMLGGFLLNPRAHGNAT